MNYLKIPSYQEELELLRNQLTSALPEDALAVFDTDANVLKYRFDKILKLEPGQKAPDFSLSNAIGETVNLYKVLETSNVLLVFYRGTWCPYCNLALSQYQRILHQLEAANTSIIAISPQSPDESLSMKEKNQLLFEVLSDNGNIVAEQYTTVFKNGDKPLAAMAELGISFDDYYSDDSRELPVPAIFLIKRSGRVVYAKSEGGDYRNRTETGDILNQLNLLA